MKVSATRTAVCVDIKSSLAPLIDFLMQTLAGRFHIDVERPENDTSQGFSEVRKSGFGGKVE